MVTRKPVASGTFYPASPTVIKNQVSSFIEKAKVERVSKIIAAIVPHAGYEYSGRVAGYAYKALASANPKTIILIGPDHHSAGTSAYVWMGSSWETPLGKLEIDYELGKALLSEDRLFNRELDAHQDEHSIEVQLPFIQMIYKTEPKILPISVSAPLDIILAKQLGKSLCKATKGRDVIFIASSDFTHYGINYGYFPFFGTEQEVEDKIHELDHKAIKEIERIRPDNFIDYVKRTGATICGAMPIAILLNTLKEMRVEKGRLLKYATSAEITGDKSNSVSYAAIVFER